MTFDPMIVAWDMLGLIGDYCGKIQLNSDKVRQSYIIKTKMKQNDFLKCCFTNVNLFIFSFFEPNFI